MKFLGQGFYKLDTDARDRKHYHAAFTGSNKVSNCDKVCINWSSKTCFSTYIQYYQRSLTGNKSHRKRQFG